MRSEDLGKTLLALGAALSLAACEAPMESEGFDAEPEAVPAEALGEPASAEVAPEATPAEPDEPAAAPPAVDPDAAESVQPESETLFY